MITIELPNNLSGNIKIEVGNSNTFTVSDFDISLLSLYLDDEKLNITGEGNFYKVKIPTSKIGEHYLIFYYDDEILSPYEDYEYEVYGFGIDIMPLKVNCPNILEVYPIAKNNDVISVEMPGDANGTLTVRLYDVINYEEDQYLEFISNNTINGKTSITLTNLTPKLYAMFLDYVDEKYGNYTDYQRFDVEYSVPDINIIRPNSTGFTFNLESDANGEIVFVVDNKFYYSKVINGSANVVTSKLSSANPEMNIYYSGDEKYAYTIKKIPFTKEKVIISSPNISTQYNVGKYLIATLKDSKGKVLINAQVKIVLNGVSKTLKTDSKGQVKLLVNLAPKTYIAAVTFAGNGTHDKSTANVKVVVAKAAPKLMASKKTYKAKVKIKKYSIILKDNKGKAIKKAKLTLKIKGNTYKAITNAKGQAIFKITKLTKKGTYKAVVKFAGNSYYKAIAKNVKIVVKK